ncbi:MAG: hypothetical protein SWC96_04270 [Thermodesulfobacteriota bacterium]|nr:hypothetical protein [Thermodesulfobacteriota bacterium]
MTENAHPVPPAADGPMRRIAGTREIRTLVAALVPEMLDIWAESGTGPVRTGARKAVSKIAGGDIKNAMLDKTAMDRAPALHTLAGDPEFVGQASAQTGELVNGLYTVLLNAAGEINALDVAVKKDLMQTIISDLSSGKSAALITICCRVINDIHKDEPEFLARVLAPVFEKWITSMDFGELKELLETSTPGISALVHMVNETLWKYPAKVISLVSLAPSIINITIDALAQTLGTFNNEGTPDMVADVLLSVLREIDAQAAGRLVNQMAEQTRRFHVGSALIGEAGSPQLPNDLSSLFDAIVKEINGEVLWKARAAMAEIKSQAHSAMTDVLANNPDLLTGGMATKSAVHNARIRATSHRVSTLESMDPDAVNTALGTSLENLDLQEGANAVNAVILMAGRLLEARSEAIRDKAGSLVDALDLYGASETIERAGEVAGEALLPLARAVVPPLARGILKSLAEDDDEFEDGAQAARRLLAALLKNGEAD